MTSFMQLLALIVACVALTHGQNLCKNGVVGFNGIIPNGQNELFVIKGENYWKLDGDLSKGFTLRKDGYPKKINTYWRGVPPRVDTAVYNKLTGKSYFMKGEHTWAFNGLQLLPGYPKEYGVKHILSSLEKDDDEAIRNLVTKARDSNAVACFPSHAYVYFFKGNQYTKYKISTGELQSGYPKDVVPFWFTCPEETSSEDEEQSPAEIMIG